MLVRFLENDAEKDISRVELYEFAVGNLLHRMEASKTRARSSELESGMARRFLNLAAFEAHRLQLRVVADTPAKVDEQASFSARNGRMQNQHARFVVNTCEHHSSTKRKRKRCVDVVWTQGVRVAAQGSRPWKQRQWLLCHGPG